MIILYLLIFFTVYQNIYYMNIAHSIISKVIGSAIYYHI